MCKPQPTIAATTPCRALISFPSDQAKLVVMIAAFFQKPATGG